MAREKLSLTNDGPLVVKLDFGPEGVEYPSKYGKGTEFMYTVNDDANIVYLTPEARDAVIKSGAQAGDEVSISKRRAGNGFRYFVELMSDAKEQPAQAPARQERFTQKPKENMRPGPQAVQRGAAVRQEQATPQYSYPLMDRCMRTACNIVKETCDFAVSIGLQLDPVTVEDIRTVGITLFIKESNGR